MRVTAFSKNLQIRLTVVALVLLALATPLFFSNISAATKDSLKIENFDVSYNSGRITATAVVKNESGNKLRFTPTLTIEKKGGYTVVGDSLEVGASQILWTEQTKGFVTLGKDEERKISFDFFLSNQIPKDTYTIVLANFSEFADSLGSVSIRRSFEGEGVFLDFTQESCRVLKTVSGQDERIEAFVAPPFEPGQRPKAICSVRNTSSVEVSAKAIFHTNILRAFGYFLANPEVSQGEEVSLLPRQTKDITITLPAKQNPQVYEAGLQFVDPANSSNRLSSVVPLRWTIKGQAARIESVKVESVKDSLLGKKIALKIGYFGSPDFFWNGSNFGEKDKFKGSALKATLKVEVVGKGSATCGRSQSEISANSDKIASKELTVEVGVCDNPTLSVKIVDNEDKVLSSADGLLIAGLENVVASSFAFVIFIVLLVGSFGIFGVVFLKLKKK